MKALQSCRTASRNLTGTFLFFELPSNYVTYVYVFKKEEKTYVLKLQMRVKYGKVLSFG